MVCSLAWGDITVWRASASWAATRLRQTGRRRITCLRTHSPGTGTGPDTIRQPYCSTCCNVPRQAPASACLNDRFASKCLFRAKQLAGSTANRLIGWIGVFFLLAFIFISILCISQSNYPFGTIRPCQRFHGNLLHCRSVSQPRPEKGVLHNDLTPQR